MRACVPVLVLACAVFISAACGGAEPEASPTQAPRTLAPFQPSAIVGPSSTPRPATWTPGPELHVPPPVIGIPAIDDTVRVVADRRFDALEGMFRTQSIACTNTAPTAGRMCPDGVPEGTLREVVFVAQCEGGGVTREQAASLTEQFLAGRTYLLAAWRVEVEVDGAATPGYAIVFAHGRDDPASVTLTLVEDGGIVAATGACGATMLPDDVDYVLRPADEG